MRKNIINMTSFCPKVVNMTTLIGPKRVHKQKRLIFPTYFASQQGPEDVQPHKISSEPEVILAHSGVTLRALGVYESYFGIIWINENYFGVILIRFQKTIVFPTYCNELAQTTG